MLVSKSNLKVGKRPFCLVDHRVAECLGGCVPGLTLGPIVLGVIRVRQSRTFMDQVLEIINLLSSQILDQVAV